MFLSVYLDQVCLIVILNVDAATFLDFTAFSSCCQHALEPLPM